MTNDAGTWVKLTVEAIKQLGCKESATEAYALAFSKERDKEFLEEVEVSQNKLICMPSTLKSQPFDSLIE